MIKGQYLSAREAVTELGVSEATLYAYVSRGLVRSESAGDNKRTRRYHREDIEQLKERKELRRNPAKLTTQALSWGTPILESGITLIADGRLYYRGHDVLTLISTQSVEQVAALIWLENLTVTEAPLFVSEDNRIPTQFRAIRRRLAEEVGLLELFQIVLPIAASQDMAAYDLRSVAVAQTGARILQLLALVAANRDRSRASLAQTLQESWVPRRLFAVRVLNAALILCADHELNVSSFTARCVASAGSTPYAVVLAGLAALQGNKHGGLTAQVEAFLKEVGIPGRAHPVITHRLRRGERLPGFGHPLYPDGDPRGKALLELVAQVCPDSPAVALAHAIVAAMQHMLGEHPTIDFGLATLALALELPAGAALALFALGRTIGWIGHAIEQYQKDQLIRPRARYVGQLPVSG